MRLIHCFDSDQISFYSQASLACSNTKHPQLRAFRRSRSYFLSLAEDVNAATLRRLDSLDCDDDLDLGEPTSARRDGRRTPSSCPPSRRAVDPILKSKLGGLFA